MQKFYLLILFVMTFQFSCTSPYKSFPERKEVLIEEFATAENLFPITLIDLSKKGIQEKLPIIYVFFDPANESTFPENEDVDHFSFHLESNGKWRPSFSMSTLEISNDYKEYLLESIEKFNTAKKENTSLQLIIDTTAEPEWWQEDETPLSSNGEKCIFICQLDTDELVTDDCRMYVFYDPTMKVMKCIYQRT